MTRDSKAHSKLRRRRVAEGALALTLIATLVFVATWLLRETSADAADESAVTVLAPADDAHDPAHLGLELPAVEGVSSLATDSASRAPQLIHSGWVTGRIVVRDLDGQPVPGIELSTASTALAEVRPLDAVSFELRAPAGRPVTVFASAAGFADAWHSIIPLHSEASLDEFSMRPHTGEWGRVMGNDDRPLAGETIEFHWKTGRRVFGRNRITRSKVGRDGRVYCGFSGEMLTAAYRGRTPRGDDPDPERRLEVLRRDPLYLRATP